MKIRCLSLLLFALVPASRAEIISYAATNLWTAVIGLHNQTSPALSVEGVIYLTTWSGKLLAINPDGTQRWNYEFGFESASSPAVGADGTIYFGSRNRKFYAVDDAGKEKWQFAAGGWIDAAPAIGADGTLYFGSWDKSFYAVGADGAKRWTFLTGGPIVSSAAIATNGVIYFGSHDKKFYALNPDGTKRWEFLSGGAILSSPAIGAAGEIYFTSTDGNFYALNPDGSRRWTLQTGGFTGSSPVIGPDGDLFISVGTNHCALTPDGKLAWQRNFWHPEPNRFGESAAAVLANNHVVFSGGDGFVMTVPKERGNIDWVWNCWMYGPSYSSVAVSTNGVIYALSTSLTLWALDEKTPLAHSPWPMFRADPQHTGRVRPGGELQRPSATAAR